jgi:hypothetical protein
VIVRYTCRVTRLTVIALALLAGCSKKRDDKPAAAQATGGAGSADPAKEAARSSGLLGPTDQGSFEGDMATDKGAPNKAAPVPGNPAASKAVVAVSKVTLEPAGDTAPLSEAIKKRMDELTACYQDALMSHDGEQGVVTLTFTLKPDGKLGDVAVKSMLDDSSLETCYSDSFKSVKVDKPLGKKPLKATVELTLSLE